MATTWNPADKSANITLTGGNLVATWNGSSGGGRSTTSKTTGKLYLEITFNVIDASTFFGLANSSLSTGNPPNTANVIWATLAGAFIQGNGNGSLGSSGGSMTLGATAAIAVDIGNSLFWYRNATTGNWNGNPANSPTSGTGGVSFSYLTGPFFAYTGAQAGSSGNQITVNFGGSAFAGSVPTGFSAWDNTSVSFTLAANDATDTAAFNLALSNRLALAANDATDTAHFNLSLSDRLALAATEAADTAHFNLGLSSHFTLAATDARDTAHFNLGLANDFRLAANDATDTAHFSLGLSPAFALAVNDAVDTASFNLGVLAQISMNRVPMTGI